MSQITQLNYPQLLYKFLHMSDKTCNCLTFICSIDTLLPGGILKKIT